MSIVIAKIRNKNDADFIAQFIRKLNGKVMLFNEEELENKWMIKMIDEAEKEEGEVREKEILKILKRNGVKVQA